MYTLYDRCDKIKKRYLSEVRYQDGTDRREFDDEQQAVEYIIASARAYNHEYIRKDDITYRLVTNDCNDTNMQSLLNNIQHTLNEIKNNNPAIKYRITEEECKIIIALREGKCKITWGSGDNQ